MASAAALIARARLLRLSVLSVVGVRQVHEREQELNLDYPHWFYLLLQHVRIIKRMQASLLSFLSSYTPLTPTVMCGWSGKKAARSASRDDEVVVALVLQNQTLPVQVVDVGE